LSKQAKRFEKKRKYSYLCSCVLFKPDLRPSKVVLNILKVRSSIYVTYMGGLMTVLDLSQTLIHAKHTLGF
jgi:hypothetical protein